MRTEDVYRAVDRTFDCLYGEAAISDADRQALLFESEDLLDSKTPKEAFDSLSRIVEILDTPEYLGDIFDGENLWKSVMMAYMAVAKEVGVNQNGTGPPTLEVIGVTGIPEVAAGDRIGGLVAAAAEAQGTPVRGGDVLVVTQKIVSKAEGRLVDLRDVEPSTLASHMAEESGKDPRLVELVLRESRAIVRVDADRGIMITETRHGFVCANAGVDTSNVPGEHLVSLLPERPDDSAEAIRMQVRGAAGVSVAVVISDTFGRAWREGHVNFAIGVSGINPVKDYRGTPDAYGQDLKVTSIAVADELAAAAELVTAKSINVPAAIVRGYAYDPAPDGVRSLLRDRSIDLFR